ncbi:hypothetical protein N1028_12675 [Herbiconiux sp. CPCC 203407]|uniref:Bacterial Ig-like domain-containing protein n=1 Tax=Herbiconiux oxytropis TaxID=2970915 RepID=A0AA41XI19_9MICO|nr:hypothetical protein [Herbiconiux oxytropis]MCS5721624.1 hypothetical protein [Herbiconiux oxytropis]MCS5726749.1 hypothetical protein [Herbiconiux oxytropis]
MFSAWRWVRGAATVAAALAAAATAAAVVVGGVAGAAPAWAAPAPTVTSAPAEGSVAVAGPDGFGVVLAGTSAPGTVVEVTMPVEGDGYPLCLVAVEPDGSWVCPIDVAPSSPGPATVSNGVDVGAPDVTVLDFGLLNPPTVETDPGSTDTITPTMTIEDPTQEIRGTGVPFNLVTVQLNDGSGCSTTVGPDGAWSCLLTALPTGPGPYSLVASQAFPTAPDATATTPPIVFALEAPTIVDPGPGPRPGPGPEPWPGSEPGSGPGPVPGPVPGTGSEPGTAPGAPPAATPPSGSGAGGGQGSTTHPRVDGDGEDLQLGEVDGHGISAGSADGSGSADESGSADGSGSASAGSARPVATAGGPQVSGVGSDGQGGSAEGSSTPDSAARAEGRTGGSAAGAADGSTAASGAGSASPGPSAFSSALATAGDVVRKGAAGLMFLGVLVAAAVVLVMVPGGVLEATIHENSERIRRSAPVRGLAAGAAKVAAGAAAARRVLWRGGRKPAAGTPPPRSAEHRSAEHRPAEHRPAEHRPAGHRSAAHRPAARRSAAGVAVVLGVGAVAAAGVSPEAGANAATLGLVLAFFGAGVAMGVVGVGAAVVVGRRHGLHGAPFGRPVALLLTIASVGVSRAAGLDPGFGFGALVGVQFVVAAPSSPRRSAVSGHVAARLAVVGAAVSVGLGLAAWVAQGALRPAVALQPDLAGVLVLDLLTAVTVGALSGPVVSLLPVRFLDGRAVFEHSKRLWALCWSGVALVFGLVLLPVPEAWNEVGGALVPWLAGFAAFAVLTAAVWAWFRFVPAPGAAPDATPEAGPDAAREAVLGAAPDQRSSRATSRDTGSLSR